MDFIYGGQKCCKKISLAIPMKDQYFAQIIKNREEEEDEYS